jgi:uncharacterized repeat protein (TIGR03803 family)
MGRSLLSARLEPVHNPKQPQRFGFKLNRTLSCMVLAACLPLAASIARAQTLTPLYTFQGAPDGDEPNGGVVMDSKGNIYGTTEAGGKGSGTIFKLAAGKESWVYSFQGPPKDGSAPGYVTLIADTKGNYYGTTAFGGNGPCKESSSVIGCGTVFRITSAGAEKVLYHFQYTNGDGAGANGTLVMDSAGNLYGTTEGGGVITGGCATQGCGTVYELSPSTSGTYTEKVLYKFCSKTNCTDGAGPNGVLARDSVGNLYGTTLAGGKFAGNNKGGTVFKLTSSGVETVLYNFCTKTNCTDGNSPFGGVTLDTAKSLLYGLTVSGGTGLCGQVSGGGVLFQVTTAGKYTVLHDFDSSKGDGCGSYGAGVTVDSAGNLFGTTLAGGDGSPQGGTVFEYSAAGKEQVLYNFNALGELGTGSNPTSTLIDVNGKLYGTTVGGGGGACSVIVDGTQIGGCGIVFELTP